MFEFLGLTAQLTRTLGWVLIIVSAVLIVLLLHITFKLFKQIQHEKKETETNENNKIDLDKQEKISSDTEKDANVKNNTDKSKVDKEDSIINEYLERLKSLSAKEKEYYTTIKNTYYLYDDIKNTLRVDGESFIFNKRIVGNITIKNKQLKLFLALSKKDLDQRFNNTTSDYKKYQKAPLEFVLNEDVDLRKSISAIKTLAEELELKEKENYKPILYKTILAKLNKLK